MRKLSSDETELWRKVTASIRPLSRDGADQAGPEPEPGPEPEEGPAAKSRTPKPVAPRTPPPAERGPGKTLDGTWDKRLRSGTVQPDRTLDLHGMNLDNAWHAIDHVLEQAIAAGDRVVLLITGHHRSGEPPIRRGQIRAAVHDWLNSSRHAPRIAAVRGAHPRHGGGGSLYLILRRR